MEKICLNTPAPISNILIWLFPKPEIDLHIMKLKENWEDSEKRNLANQYIRSKYYSYLDIYTDGSKDDEGRVGIGISNIDVLICSYSRLCCKLKLIHFDLKILFYVDSGTISTTFKINSFWFVSSSYIFSLFLFCSEYCSTIKFKGFVLK